MSTRLLESVRKALPNITVEDHPYDIGYWARVAGFPRNRCPRNADGRRGWDTADKEHAVEGEAS